METTHVEVTYEGVLVAVDGDVERKLTSEEFSIAFEQMAEKLYEIDGLVDPSLWGQASNGQIELDFCLPSSGNTKEATAHAMAVIEEVTAARGIDIDSCDETARNGEKPAALVAANSAPGCPQLVLNGVHRTTDILLKA